MRKLLFLTLLFLSSQARASGNFIDALGGRCGTILFEIEGLSSPNDIKQNKIQLSKIKELKACLDLYTQYGGNFQELNKRYETALNLSRCDIKKFSDEILKNQETNNKKNKQNTTDTISSLIQLHYLSFQRFIKNSNCLNYYLYKDKYPDCATITYLSTECNTNNNTK